MTIMTTAIRNIKILMRLMPCIIFRLMLPLEEVSFLLKVKYPHIFCQIIFQMYSAIIITKHSPYGFPLYTIIYI